MAPVLAGERVREDLACNRADAERVVEFAINEQSGVGRDDRAAKLEHQPAVEIQSKNLATQFTRLVRSRITC